MIAWIHRAPVLRGRWARRFEPVVRADRRRRVVRCATLVRRRVRGFETWQPSPVVHFRHVSMRLGYAVRCEAFMAGYSAARELIRRMRGF